MRRLFITLLIALGLASCDTPCTCTIDYQLETRDSVIVKQFVFKGQECATYRIAKGETYYALDVAPFGDFAPVGRPIRIDAISTEDGKITILGFKYRYKMDSSRGTFSSIESYGNRE